MASEYVEEDAYEQAAVDDDNDDIGDIDDPLVTERLADADERQEDEAGSSDAAPLSSCWSALIATAAAPAADAPRPSVPPPAGDAVAIQSPRQLPPPQRRRRLEKEQLQLQALGRQLAQQKKLNAELQQQLFAFRKNEAVAQLENRNKEKQLQIEQLLQENRLLVHQQRLLAKQVEELQDDKDNFPLKKHALQEELRVCKESLRRHKEKQKDADEKAFRTHQQAVDLATKNKTLLERLKRLEAPEPLSPASGSFESLPSSYVANGASASLVGAESIIASQEDEITRLQQRVSLMKKTQRSERSKQDHRLQSSQAEVELARQQLDAFHQQLFAKEKTIRSLFLQMKSLKRAVLELTNAQQTNHHMQQMVFGRDVRFLGQHSPPRQNQQQSHHHYHLRTNQQQQPLGQHSPSRLHASASVSAHALPHAAPRKETTDRVYHTLRQLGYIPSFVTQSPRKRFDHESERRDGDQQHAAAAANGDNEEGEEDEEELPPNCIQGRLVPGPPPSSAARRAIQSSGSGRALRVDAFAPAAPSSRRTSSAAFVTSDASMNEAIEGDGTHEGPKDSREADDGAEDANGSEASASSDAGGDDGDVDDDGALN